MTDQAFRDQLISDPDSALAGFDLTKEERTALLSGDPVDLEAMGVDERLTKRTGGAACPDPTIHPFTGR